MVKGMVIGLMYSEKLAFIITVNFRFGDHDTLLLQTPQHWRTAHNWSPAKYIEALTEKNACY